MRSSFALGVRRVVVMPSLLSVILSFSLSLLVFLFSFGEWVLVRQFYSFFYRYYYYNFTFSSLLYFGHFCNSLISSLTFLSNISLYFVMFLHFSILFKNVIVHFFSFSFHLWPVSIFFFFPLTTRPRILSSYMFLHFFPSPSLSSSLSPCMPFAQQQTHTYCHENFAFNFNSFFPLPHSVCTR